MTEGSDFQCFLHHNYQVSLMSLGSLPGSNKKPIPTFFLPLQDATSRAYTMPLSVISFDIYMQSKSRKWHLLFNN